MSKILFSIILVLGSFAQAASYNVTRVSDTTTLTSSQTVVLVTGSTYIITLPSCDLTTDGEYHIFKDTDTDSNSSVQISGSETDTIEGSNFFVDFAQSDTFVCDGPNHNWLGVAYW